MTLWKTFRATTGAACCSVKCCFVGHVGKNTFTRAPIDFIITSKQEGIHLCKTFCSPEGTPKLKISSCDASMAEAAGLLIFRTSPRTVAPTAVSPTHWPWSCQESPGAASASAPRTLRHTACRRCGSFSRRCSARRSWTSPAGSERRTRPPRRSKDGSPRQQCLHYPERSVPFLSVCYLLIEVYFHKLPKATAVVIPDCLCIAEGLQKRVSWCSRQKAPIYCLTAPTYSTGIVLVCC